MEGSAGDCLLHTTNGHLRPGKLLAAGWAHCTEMRFPLAPALPEAGAEPVPEGTGEIRELGNQRGPAGEQETAYGNSRRFEAQRHSIGTFCLLKKPRTS